MQTWRTTSSLGGCVVGMLLLSMLSVPSAVRGAEEAAPAAKAKKVKIVLAGDSTVADGSGWGSAFAKRLKAGAECVNLARGGRSSKSYRDEGWWAKVLAQKPDFVLIQFGHNDQPGKGKERETDPKTTFRENLARYVDEARAAGAAPILITSLARRNFGKDGKIVDTLRPYAEAALAVAAEKKVPAVDLHALSIAELERIGPQAAAAYDPATKDPAKPDRTHLSPAGAEASSALVAAELAKVAPKLSPLLIPPDGQAPSAGK